MKSKKIPEKSFTPPPAEFVPAAPLQSNPTHGEISVEAEALWRLKGSPSGRDHEIWLEAEGGLRRRSQLERDKRDAMALADPAFAFNADKDDLMTELNERFPGQNGPEPTSL